MLNQTVYQISPPKWLLDKFILGSAQLNIFWITEDYINSFSSLSNFFNVDNLDNFLKYIKELKTYEERYFKSETLCILIKTKEKVKSIFMSNEIVKSYFLSSKEMNWIFIVINELITKLRNIWNKIENDIKNKSKKVIINSYKWEIEKIIMCLTKLTHPNKYPEINSFSIITRENKEYIFKFLLNFDEQNLELNRIEYNFIKYLKYWLYSSEQIIEEMEIYLKSWWKYFPLILDIISKIKLTLSKESILNKESFLNKIYNIEKLIN